MTDTAKVVIQNSNKAKKLNISGVILLDKPLNLTSAKALQIVKAIFRARKAGHTGSLDPLATGMLPICLGEATKFCQFLLEANKRYWVKARLGVRTATGDAEGDVVATRTIPKLRTTDLEQILEKFRGEIEQVPSMYSALKYNGQPLYKLARQGLEVERKGRIINIFELKLLELHQDEIILSVHCSKGTYIRTLIEDIGEDLGCGAHVTELRRLQVAHYQQDKMINLTTLKVLAEQNNRDALYQYLLPVETSTLAWPAMQLTETASFYLRQGQTVMVPNTPSDGWVRLYNHEQQFIGMGEIMSNGKIAPRRLLAT